MAAQGLQSIRRQAAQPRSVMILKWLADIRYVGFDTWLRLGHAVLGQLGRATLLSIRRPELADVKYISSASDG